MSCVDCFVIVKDIVTDLPKFVSVKVVTHLLRCAVEPVLGIPVYRGTINLHGFWDWAVYFCIPLVLVKDGVVG